MLQDEIDFTPSWEGVAPLLLAALEYGEDSARFTARAEVQRMARIADERIAVGREAADYRMIASTVQADRQLLIDALLRIHAGDGDPFETAATALNAMTCGGAA